MTTTNINLPKTSFIPESIRDDLYKLGMTLQMDH